MRNTPMSQLISIIAVLLIFLSSCSKDVEMDIVKGQDLSVLLSTYGTPNSIDTVECWHIGDGNCIEFSNAEVYDYTLNADDSAVAELMQYNREQRKAHRPVSPSILDVRLLMLEEDLDFLVKSVDSTSHCYYYNYGINRRVQVASGKVLAFDRGLRNNLLVLDKIRLNLGAGSMLVINITLAFIMFGVALNMKLKGFRELIKNPRPILAGIISQFILLPAVTFLLVLLLKPPTSIALGMMLVAACPGGNVSNFICTLAKGNIELSVTLTAIATMLAVVMTPFNFTFWGGLYANASGMLVPISIDWWQMTKIVLMLLGLPIVLGMLVRHYFHRIANMIEKPMRWFSIVFFLVIIVGAIVQNFTYFSKYAFLIVGIVLLHNFVAFFTGYSFASIMRVRTRERRTITIETGIQNSGLALVLIVNPLLFDGLGGMAFIAAVWGVWHIVSGMLVGSIWSLVKLKGD